MDARPPETSPRTNYRSPGEVPQPDFTKQRTEVQPGSAGYGWIAATEATEAAEADLIDQTTDLSPDAADEYPDAVEDPGR